MNIDLVYWSYRGGWYADVWSTETGATLHTTEVYQTREEAREAAEKWRDEAIRQMWR